MKQLQLFLLSSFMIISSSLFAQRDGDNETSTSALRAQVIADDLIVQGSIATGFDASSAESFGFDTFRLKENNLRIHFDDTSTSSTFPSNDWRFLFNDTSNGGANYFAVENATSGAVPFKVDAGAASNALIVDQQGDVGIGTATPVVEFHIADGDSPTMRLEQDASAGFASQTWDIAGNETNFFVRDVTNGSKLPFKIKPGAPDNSLFVAANGNIALGNQNPTHKLDVDGSADILNDLYVGNQLGVGTATPDANASADLAATDKGLLLNRLDNVGKDALGTALTTATTGAGMLIYDTDDTQTYFWNGTTWMAPGTDNQDLTGTTLTGTTLTVEIENGASVDIDLAPILVPLQDENIAQQAQIDDLLARVLAIEACACDGTLSVEDPNGDAENRIILNQNIPNPFATTSSITYFIPSKYTRANLEISTSLGQLLYNIPLNEFGKQASIEINKSSFLSSAIYYYSLYVDGKKMITKKLIVK